MFVMYPTPILPENATSLIDYFFMGWVSRDLGQETKSCTLFSEVSLESSYIIKLQIYIKGKANVSLLLAKNSIFKITMPILS